MRLFKKIKFDKIDPLGDGLAEAIQKEQAETEAFWRDGPLCGDHLASQWQQVLDDAREDGDWFHFAPSD